MKRKHALKHAAAISADLIAIADIVAKEELSYLDDKVIDRICDLDFRVIGEVISALAKGK